MGRIITAYRAVTERTDTSFMILLIGVSGTQTWQV